MNDKYVQRDPERLLATKEKQENYQSEQRAFIEAELRKSGILANGTPTLNAVDNTASALEKLSKHIASIDFGGQNPCEACGRSGLSPEASGKLLAYLAKVVDELTRLVEFAKGKPDQRVEVANLNDLMRVLQALPNEKFLVASKLIEEAIELADETNPN